MKCNMERYLEWAECELAKAMEHEICECGTMEGEAYINKLLKNILMVKTMQGMHGEPMRHTGKSSAGPA
ncbi:MAG: hypothetical protein FWG72_01975 [Oscillospiraceae bacterium]|nr:hypothetical protein [Oscillospiraceae bacterium]